MAEHYPGPWLYRPTKYDDWGWIRASDGTLVAAAKDSTVTEQQKNEHRNNRTDPFEGNARLIAAAPEMLEALKIAERDLAEFFPVSAQPASISLRAIRAAIAKATGEHS